MHIHGGFKDFLAWLNVPYPSCKAQVKISPARYTAGVHEVITKSSVTIVSICPSNLEKFRIQISYWICKNLMVFLF